jgi:hypothetical protein
MGDQAALEYLLDISHAASSSSQASTCSVEPGSAEDVSKIVSYLDLMHQLLQTHIFIATYPGIKPNSLCGEKWGSYHEPRILLDERSRDRDDTLQQDKDQFHAWNSRGWGWPHLGPSVCGT